jgi:rhodanese-related sulfurtransferase
MDASITPAALQQALRSSNPPLVVDVRKNAAFLSASDMIRGALRRDPERLGALPRADNMVVYCVHGHEVSQNAAKTLSELGIAARFLEGGLEEGWKAAGGAIAGKPKDAATRWVTRERPKIDRIACPWLIRRFIDPSAEFFYVPNVGVRAFAAANDATAYDIPDVTYSHVGPLCSFDAFVRIHNLGHPALAQLATIVRGADTGALDLAPQAPGLLAASLGLSALFADDHAMLKWGMLVYDSLYEWCRGLQDETHGWYPRKLRALEDA